MIRSLKAAIAFSGALMVGSFLGATPYVSHAYADAFLGVTGPAAQSASQMKEPPPDPNKKKDGEACKSADECQKHHTCDKVDGKSVCQAPPPPELPPGAVT